MQKYIEELQSTKYKVSAINESANLCNGVEVEAACALDALDALGAVRYKAVCSACTWHIILV